MDFGRLWAQSLSTLCEHMQAQSKPNAPEFVYVEKLATSDQHFTFFCILVDWLKKGLNFSSFRL